MINFLIVSIILLNEGFEGGSLPYGWRVGNGGSPLRTWRIAQYGEYFPVEPPQQGNYYILCDTNSILYQDTLFTPGIDVPTSIVKLKLYYNISFLKDTISLSRGDILIRTKAQAGSWTSWVPVKIYGGSPVPIFVNQRDSVDLQSFINADSIKIAFAYYRLAQDTGFFMLDYIVLSAKLGNDVGATKIISPREYFEANVPTPITIEFQNFSNNTLSFYVKCEIKDSLTRVRVYRDSGYVTVGPLRKDTIQLSNFTGQAEKTYYVLGWTNYALDPDPTNDTVKAYSKTKPFFGAIIKEIPLPGTSTAFQDITFKTGDNLIFIVNQEKDTVFSIDDNGNVISKYKLQDFSQGTTIDVPFGIFYDKESGTFYTSQIGVPQGGGSPVWCYLVHYSANFSLIDSFNTQGKGLGVNIFALCDAQGENLGFMHRAIYPARYRIYKLNFLNEANPKVDSLNLTQPLYFLAGALEALNDTLFISSGMGLTEIKLFTKSGVVLKSKTFDGDVRGIAVERRVVGEYINAYVNIGGTKLYKISTGLKWSSNIFEKEKVLINNVIPTLVVGQENLLKYKIKKGLIDLSGRRVKTSGVSKILYIKDGDKKFKVILLR
ncbi:MAG: hypothetical protein ABDH49_06100 [Candidatus Hydrothermales bacterium]